MEAELNVDGEDSGPASHKYGTRKGAQGPHHFFTPATTQMGQTPGVQEKQQNGECAGHPDGTHRLHAADWRLKQRCSKGSQSDSQQLPPWQEQGEAV